MMQIEILRQDSLDHIEHLRHHWKRCRAARWHLAQFAPQVAVALDKGRTLLWSDGTTGIKLSQLALLEQLVAIVPLPRAPLSARLAVWHHRASCGPRLSPHRVSRE